MSTPGAITQKHFISQKEMRNAEVEVSNCPKGTFS